MKVSPHGMRSVPLLIAALLAAGGVVFLAAPRRGGPSPLERVIERAGAAARDTDADSDAEPKASEHPVSRAGGSPDQDADTDAADDQGAPGIAKFDPEGLQLARLRIERAGYHWVRSRLALTGMVEPNLAGVVKVTPRVAGKITSVRVNVGDPVGAGQILATLTSTELAQAQAAYRQATARAAVARVDLQRQEKLASLGAFSSPSLEAARDQAATAEANAGTMQTAVAGAGAGVDQASSQLLVLRTALEQAQAQAEVTQSQFDRSNLLLKAGIVSQQAWEQARADNQKAQADVDAARAKIAQGQAGIETARANLVAAQANLAAARKRDRIAAQALAREQAVYQGGYATSRQLVAAKASLRQAQLDRAAAADSVRLLGGRPGGGDVLSVTAPLSGEVTARQVTLGQSVAPSDTLFTIMNLRTVWVQLNAYPSDVPAIHAGQPVTVTSDTTPGRTFDGTVSFVSDLMDPATHTVPVRCVIRNAGGHPQGAPLRPGTFARGTIAAGRPTRALVAPAGAIQQLSGRSVVFVPGGRAGEFLARPVEVGAPFGPWVEIRSGLAPGDRLVTRNAFLVKSQAMKSQPGDEDEDQDKGDKE